MRTTRVVRKWDREKADFVDIVVQTELDASISCGDCRYYKSKEGICEGVGSRYYMKRIPISDFNPAPSECEVRLPLDLFAFV
ncbi:MAG: hypothetical protein EAX95_08410 [Candidatus Thorarchaeota archaeon]|nr:hypothetical protein [Candidatus Thorarchaeota archaeon]